MASLRLSEADVDVERTHPRLQRNNTHLCASLAGGDEFVWVGSAYTLAGTAFIPLSGHLANIFGRRPLLIIALLLFAFGSALSGGAQSMAMLIGGRSMYNVFLSHIPVVDM